MQSPVDVGLVIEGVTKRYGATLALKGLDMIAGPGVIHGVIGPNGAGKTTLVRILAGEVRPDAGTMTLDGRPLAPGERHGMVALVHQEPQLFPTLTVSENIMAGHEGTRVGRPKPTPAQRRIEDELDLSSRRDLLLELMPISVRQRTEIARALVREAKVFVFDEPNSSLTVEESQELFRWIHRLADEGMIVLLVSHRLAEVAEHADRAFVFKDGSIAQIIERSDLTEERLARSLISMKDVVRQEVRSRRPRSTEPGVTVSLPGQTVTVHEAEVTAVLGVEDSGAKAFMGTLARLRPDGAEPATVPADRRMSLYPNMSVMENLATRAVSTPLVLQNRLRTDGQGAIERFSIKVGDPADPIGTLSGGNQQKVAMSAAILAEPPILLLEEPTRGVDISSRRDIHAALRTYASLGRIVVAHCSEVTEVYEFCDRALVFRKGRLSGDLRIGDFAGADDLAAQVAADAEIFETEQEP